MSNFAQIRGEVVARYEETTRRLNLDRPPLQTTPTSEQLAELKADEDARRSKNLPPGK